MSDERIDLTRFEGHTKGEWRIDDGNLMVRTDEISVRLAEPYWDDGITADEDTINKKLMISAPDLLAELERCYEEIDLAHRNLSIVRNALARGYPDIEEEIWKLIDASE